MEQNNKAFTKKGAKFVLAYLESSIDANLSARLATLRNDEGEKNVTDETPISTIFDHLQELFLK